MDANEKASHLTFPATLWLTVEILIAVAAMLAASPMARAFEADHLAGLLETGIRFIQKPFDLQELARQVQSAIRRT